MAEFIDLTGKKFGDWTVLEFSQERICSLTAWKCQCSCGTIKIVVGGSLKAGKSLSCGHSENLTNKRFGRLLVVNETDKKNYWNCLCDCGNSAVIYRANLLFAGTSSCGCLSKEGTSKRCTKDIINQVFGRLTVIKQVIEVNKKGVFWECSCTCGNTIIAPSKELLRHHKLSCGCFQQENRIDIGRRYRESIGKDPNILLTTKNEQLRGKLGDLKLKQIVLIRDSFKCIFCRSNKNLHIHHIIPLVTDETKFFDVNNMVTLCRDCHKKAHNYNNKKINPEIQKILQHIIEFLPF